MPLDFVEIVRRVESYYPAAIGGTAHDEALRQMIVPWANDVLLELNQMQRFSYDYGQTTFTTVQGTPTYPMPASMMVVKRMFYIGPEGSPVQIDKRERFEAARVLGDDLGTNVSQQGAPRMWSLDNRTITLFPTPNLGGFDAGGNYIVYVQGYNLLSPIIEATGSTTAGNANLTVVDTATISTAAGTSTPTVSVRGSGLQLVTGGAVTQGFVNAVASTTNATTFLCSSVFPAAATNAQTFFNSQPWPVTYWPKVLLFALLREVSAYLHSQDEQMWSQRYMDELSLLRNYEYDRTHTIEMKIAAHAGQETAEERRLDEPVGMDIRGVL